MVHNMKGEEYFLVYMCLGKFKDFVVPRKIKDFAILKFEGNWVFYKIWKE